MDRLVAETRPRPAPGPSAEAGAAAEPAGDEPAVAVAPDVAAAPLPGGPRALVRELRALLRVRTVFHIYVGIMTLFAGLSGIAFWLPTYYEREFDLNQASAAGLAAALGLVVTLTGTVVGGTVGDNWHGVRRGARILLAGFGLLVGSFTLPVAFLASNLVVNLAALSFGLLAMSVAIPNLSAAVADVLPAAKRGIGFGLFSFLTAIGGAMGPLAVGAVADAVGSLEGAFLVLVVPIVIGSLVVLGARHTFDDDVAAVLDAA
jgi:MFS family permease